MTGRRIKLTICLAALVPWMASCIAQQPNDLEVDRIEVTSSREAGIGPSEPFPGGSPDVLEIDVATPTDLEHFAANYGALVRFTVKFCPPIGGLGPRVGIVYPNSFTGQAGNIGGSRDFRGVFHYKIFAYISDGAFLNGTRPPYDLVDYPRDICIGIYGGNETGFGYRSNVAIASRNQIIAALKLPPRR